MPRVPSLSDHEAFAHAFAANDLPPCQRMGVMASFRSFDEFAW